MLPASPIRPLQFWLVHWSETTFAQTPRQCLHSYYSAVHCYHQTLIIMSAHFKNEYAVITKDIACHYVRPCRWSNGPKACLSHAFVGRKFSFTLLAIAESRPLSFSYVGQCCKPPNSSLVRRQLLWVLHADHSFRSRTQRRHWITRQQPHYITERLYITQVMKRSC